MMLDTERITLDLLARIAVVPPGGFKPEHRLRQDLEVDGDDYGMTFVRQIERHLGFHAPVDAWEVGTVGEVLAVVRRYAPTSQPADRR